MITGLNTKKKKSRGHIVSNIFGIVGLCLGMIPGFIIIYACSKDETITGIFVPLIGIGAVMLILIFAVISVRLYELFYKTALKFYKKKEKNREMEGYKKAERDRKREERRAERELRRAKFIIVDIK